MTTRKPRIITESVERLGKVAERIDVLRAGESVSEISAEVRDIARRLDEYDARETRKDPSKRKRRVARQAKR